MRGKLLNRVVEALIYKYWISLPMHKFKLHSRNISSVDQHDGYYSFNLYRMQFAFYLVLIGWCPITLCFFV
jgi:hypothetical protein